MTDPTRLLQSVQRMPVLAVSGASITLGPTALRRLVDITTGESDSAVTLPTTGMRDGDMLFTRKADTGADAIIDWSFNYAAQSLRDFKTLRASVGADSA